MDKRRQRPERNRLTVNLDPDLYGFIQQQATMRSLSMSGYMNVLARRDRQRLERKKHVRHP